jgi:vacuolar-type H+-ATPase subunit F/Vma7
MDNNLYNVQTGQPDVLTLEQVPAAIEAGTHAYKKGTRINVIGTDSKSYSLDASELPDAFLNGYRLESPNEIAVRDYVKENKGVGGALKVGVGQFLDEAAMGLPELVLNKTQDPLEVAKREALKDEHSAANTIGGLAGFGASLFTGAPLFKAASLAGKATENYVAKKMAAATGEKILPGVATSILQNGAKAAAGMGVEGAVVSAPTAITEGMLGDPELAAETMLAGGILGSALGGAIGIAKPLIKLGKEKIAKAASEKFNSEDAALNLIGATPAQRDKLAPDVVEKIPQFFRDIAKEDPKILFSSEKLKNKVDDLVSKSGKQLDNIVTTLDDRIKHVVTTADDATITEIKGSMYDYSSLTDKLWNKFVVPYIDDPRFNAQVQKVDQEIAAIKEHVTRRLGGESNGIDLRALRDYQQTTKELVNFDKKNNVTDLGTDARKFIIDDVQKYFKDVLAPKISVAFPDLAQVASQFKAANDAYRMAVNIQPIIGKTVNKEAAKKLIGPSEIVGGIIGAGVGGVPGLLVGAAAKKAASYVEKSFDVAGILMTEQAMKQTAKKLDGIKDNLVAITSPVRARLVPKISNFTNDINNDSFTELSRKIAEVSSNPQSLEDKMESMRHLADMGAPETASATQAKVVEAFQYLQSVMPKPLTPNNVLVKSKGFKPSDQELSKFKRQVVAALDPFSIIDDLNEGTLTVDQVQTVAAIYPQLLDRIKEKVVDAVQSNPAEVPYNKRLKLSLLLGLDLDPSLEPKTLQILLNSKPAESPEQGRKPSNKVEFTSYPTDMERIQSK